MTPGKLILLFGSSDADALAWRARVNAAGGSVSQATYRAVVKFSRSCKAAGIWDKLNRVNLFCGDQLTAALVPLKVGNGSATDTNVNFVSGDYTEATGITGNGSSKYLTTAVAQNVFTANDRHLAVYERVRSGTTADTSIGSDNGVGVNPWILRTGGSAVTTEEYFCSSSTGNASVTGQSGGAFYVGTNPNVGTLYRNGSSVGTYSGLTATPGAATMFVFANNRSGPVEYSSATLAGYSIGSGLTASEVSAYNAIMEQFQDALNRGVQ